MFKKQMNKFVIDTGCAKILILEAFEILLDSILYTVFTFVF